MASEKKQTIVGVLPDALLAGLRAFLDFKSIHRLCAVCKSFEAPTTAFIKGPRYARALTESAIAYVCATLMKRHLPCAVPNQNCREFAEKIATLLSHEGSRKMQITNAQIDRTTSISDHQTWSNRERMVSLFPFIHSEWPDASFGLKWCIDHLGQPALQALYQDSPFEALDKIPADAFAKSALKSIENLTSRGVHMGRHQRVLDSLVEVLVGDAADVESMAFAIACNVLAQKLQNLVSNVHGRFQQARRPIQQYWTVRGDRQLLDFAELIGSWGVNTNVDVLIALFTCNVITCGLPQHVKDRHHSITIDFATLYPNIIYPAPGGSIELPTYADFDGDEDMPAFEDPGYVRELELKLD